MKIYGEYHEELRILKKKKELRILQCCKGNVTLEAIPHIFHFDMYQIRHDKHSNLLADIRVSQTKETHKGNTSLVA